MAKIRNLLDSIFSWIAEGILFWNLAEVNEYLKTAVVIIVIYRGIVEVIFDLLLFELECVCE